MNSLSSHARHFWLYSRNARDLIRIGEIEQAEFLIGNMRGSAMQLGNGNAEERKLAARMIRTAIDIEDEIASTMRDIARDLVEAVS